MLVYRTSCDSRREGEMMFEMFIVNCIAAFLFSSLLLNMFSISFNCCLTSWIKTHSPQKHLHYCYFYSPCKTNIIEIRSKRIWYWNLWNISIFSRTYASTRSNRIKICIFNPIPYNEQLFSRTHAIIQVM